MHQLFENIKVAGAPDIPPQDLGGKTVNGPWRSMAKYETAGAICCSGALGGGAALVFKLQQAKDASGTGAKDMAGKTVSFADTEVNVTKTIHIRAEELDVNPAFSYIRLTVTEGGQ